VGDKTCLHVDHACAAGSAFWLASRQPWMARRTSNPAQRWCWVAAGTNYLSQLLKNNVKENTVNFLHQFPKCAPPRAASRGMRRAVTPRTLNGIRAGTAHTLHPLPRPALPAAFNLMRGKFSSNAGNTNRGGPLWR
jgi:hypothetical protein